MQCYSNRIFPTLPCGSYTAFEGHYNNKKDEVTGSVFKAPELGQD